MLTVSPGTNLAFALGDYNFVPMYEEVPFNLDENYKGTLIIGFSVYHFHERIIEVAGDSEYVKQIVGYKINARKINDYYVNISGIVQVKAPMKNGEYYYTIVRIDKNLY